MAPPGSLQDAPQGGQASSFRGELETALEPGPAPGSRGPVGGHASAPQRMGHSHLTRGVPAATDL